MGSKCVLSVVVVTTRLVKLQLAVRSALLETLLSEMTQGVQMTA